MTTGVLSWSGLAVFQFGYGEWCQLPDCAIARGSRIAIIGGCGTGKTALARAFCGLPLRNAQRGEVALAGRPITGIPEAEIARKIAYVPAQAHLVFSGIRETLGEEMALTLQFLSYSASQAFDAVSKWADVIGISHLLRRDPLSLSGGEFVLAALAISLVKEPEVIVLDTSYDFLHPDTRESLRKVAVTLSGEGRTVIETFARAPDWVHTFDRCIFLSRPEVLVDSYVRAWPVLCRTAPDLLPALGRGVNDLVRSLSLGEIACPVNVDEAIRNLRQSIQSRVPLSGEIIGNRTATSAKVSNETVLKTNGLGFEYLESNFRLDGVSLEAGNGEVVALVGANGAGKTTLMKAIAYLVEPKCGTVAIASNGATTWEFPPTRSRRHRWAKYVLYGFQDPDDQLYLGSVRDELASLCRHAGKLVTSVTLEQMATSLGLGSHLETFPLNLPSSLRRMVTLAAAFLANPPVLLLDEPNAGLDVLQTRAVQQALRSYAIGGGVCLFVSHDREFVAETANRFVEMSDGRICDQGQLCHGHQPATMISSFAQQIAFGLRFQPQGNDLEA